MNESLFLGVAEALVSSGLASKGYRFMNLDCGYSAGAAVVLPFDRVKSLMQVSASSRSTSAFGRIVPVACSALALDPEAAGSRLPGTSKCTPNFQSSEPVLLISSMWPHLIHMPKVKLHKHASMDINGWGQPLNRDGP